MKAEQRQLKLCSELLCSVLAFLRRNKAVELWLGASKICIDVVPHSMYYSYCHNGVRNSSMKIQLNRNPIVDYLAWGCVKRLII